MMRVEQIIGRKAGKRLRKSPMAASACWYVPATVGWAGEMSTQICHQMTLGVALTTIGDIRIDTIGMPATSDPAATLLSFAIDREGKVNVNLSDSSQFVRGQVLLQNFSDPQGLMKEGNNLYSSIGAAGPLGGATSPTPAAPSTNGLGQIQAGALELSNVDLANEFTALITTQRGYQANARVITTSDELLQELVNLKR
jgi:flagellar hook-basal body protein